MQLGPKGKAAVSAFLSYVAENGNVSQDAKFMAHVVAQVVGVPIVSEQDTARHSAKLHSMLGEVIKTGKID